MPWYPAEESDDERAERMKPAESAIAALSPQAVPAVDEAWQIWCDTCEGSGKVYQEHQAGCNVGGEHPCPDCDGKGFFVKMLAAPHTVQPEAPQQAATQPREPMPEDEKRKLIGGFFAEDWSVEAALNLLHDFERHRGLATNQPAPVQGGLTDIKQIIRDAGGIVHGDGNIFFTNAEQFTRAALCANAGSQPDGATRLAHSKQHADIAAQLLMDAHEKAPETWRGWYDDALNHIDIARNDLDALTKPAGATNQPAPVQSGLTDVIDAFERDHDSFHLEHSHIQEWINKLRAALRANAGSQQGEMDRINDAYQLGRADEKEMSVGAEIGLDKMLHEFATESMYGTESQRKAKADAIRKAFANAGSQKGEGDQS